MNRREMRQRRARRGRLRIKARSNVNRLTVHRTPGHVYAQIIQEEAGQSRVVVCASTLDKEVKSLKAEGMDKKKLAGLVGKVIAQRALGKDIKKVSFDRSGFRYHGRVRSLADAAREGGLEF
ncbi:MAG: 50S ribosomal protein L18 [Gammaproteobacteria bacterium]